MTRVTFRKERDGEIIAVFAELATPYTFMMYSHFGQHGSICLDYYRAETRPATFEEYRGLLAELSAIGYRDLKVVKRLPVSRIGLGSF